MTELPCGAPAPNAGRRTLKSVEDELKLALTFVKISSTAYSMGKLQHAGDARSKAEAVRSRAVSQLIESLSADEDSAASVQSMLKEVQNALADLPSAVHPILGVRGAAG